MFEWSNPSVILLVISTVFIIGGIFLYRLGGLVDKENYMYGGLLITFSGCVLTMCSILFFFGVV